MFRALTAFGAPLDQLTVDDLAVPKTIFQIGVALNCIDVLTSIDAVEFDEAWTSKIATTYGGIPIGVLSLDLLLRNQRFVDRQQDRLALRCRSSRTGSCASRSGEQPSSFELGGLSGCAERGQGGVCSQDENGRK